MAKLGTQKGTVETNLKEHSKATKNRAGGVAFGFDSPAERLLATIGSAMFVEPNYYRH